MAIGPVTPIDIETWMNASNSPNPLSNLARVSAKTASVLSTLVNLQKLVVEEIASKIDRIGQLNLKIKSFAHKTDSKPEAVAVIGATAAESLDILTQMKALGVKYPKIDEWIAAVKLVNSPAVVTNAEISNLSLALQTLSESEQNKSQQESLRLQTLTNRYTQSNDQASSVIQKDGQNKGTVTNNLRGSGG